MDAVREANGREPKSDAPAQPAAFDWVLLAILVVLGAFSFSMIRVAVETVPPALVSTGRLWVGAALMYAIMRFAGRRFPPLIEKTDGGARLSRDWAFMLAVSAVGYAAPFYIFPWAQQFIPSGLAGVYMAFMPISTLGLAYFFAGESLTARKIAGFALGFVGVLILIGADVLSGAAQASIAAQLALLVATFCYGASAVISRRAPAIRPRVFAAGTVLGAAIISTPFSLLAEWRPDQWSLASLLAIVGLGAGPTGLAGLAIITLIKRAGAGFMSLANYIVPVAAVFAGAALFGEPLHPRLFAALAVILAGVALSQRRKRAPVSATSGGLAPIAVASARKRAGEKLKP